MSLFLVVGRLVQASTQARRAAPVIAGSKPLCLEKILPVVLHTSAQSRSSRMQRASVCKFSSPRQASAQALQAWTQSKLGLDALRRSANVHRG
jgi:hypothetical protein